MKAIVSALALAFAPSAASATDVVVSGYVKVMEANALVFETKKDRKALNVFKCYNVGVDHLQRSAVKRMLRRKVYLLVNTVQFDGVEDVGGAFYQIDGLPFQERCVRRPSFLLKEFLSEADARERGTLEDRGSEHLPPR